MLVHLDTIESIVATLLVDDGNVNFVMLCLAADTFLLRVSSEALPIQVGMTVAEEPVHSLVSANDTEVKLTLAGRKNRQWPTTRCRKCWCSESPATCPVHVLGTWLRTLPLGTRPRADFSPSVVTANLCALLHGLGVEGERLSLVCSV